MSPDGLAEIMVALGRICDRLDALERKPQDVVVEDEWPDYDEMGAVGEPLVARKSEPAPPTAPATRVPFPRPSQVGNAVPLSGDAQWEPSPYKPVTSDSPIAEGRGMGHVLSPDQIMADYQRNLGPLMRVRAVEDRIA